LDRASDYESEGYRFDSCGVYFFWGGKTAAFLGRAAAGRVPILIDHPIQPVVLVRRFAILAVEILGEVSLRVVGVGANGIDTVESDRVGLDPVEAVVEKRSRIPKIESFDLRHYIDKAHVPPS
jgi:hypothetical protein